MSQFIIGCYISQVKLEIAPQYVRFQRSSAKQSTSPLQMLFLEMSPSPDSTSEVIIYKVKVK